MHRPHLTSVTRHSAFGTRHLGFTLVELLVVIGIIAVLIGIAFPTIGRIRIAGQETDSRAQLAQIDQACQAYYTDHRAYPGPLPIGFMTGKTQQLQIPVRGSEGIVVAGSNKPIGDADAGTDGTIAANGSRISGSENLVLGLLGGISRQAGTPPAEQSIEFDPANVGSGAVIFNIARTGRSQPYMQGANLSPGKFADEAGQMNPSKDSDIPEFVDRFANPLPILYMRARVGRGFEAGGSGSTIDEKNNNVVIMVPDLSAGQYNLLEIAPYTQSSIGVGRTVSKDRYKNVVYDAKLPHGLRTVEVDAVMDKNDANNFYYPYDAYAYLTEPSSVDTSLTGQPRLRKMQARKKDAYVLISAGRDRVYGTEDDLTNFGSVLP